ncbi:MAG: hypothetical protein PHC61_04985 [Chitinivibrionales bacterium]|nr:hypothetical protein [Chitinivibrionales bacterium]
MGKIFMQLGSLVVFNRREKTVRGGLIFILTNLLLLSAVVFVLEIVLIALGINDIFLPLTQAAHQMLSRLLF